MKLVRQRAQGLANHYRELDPLMSATGEDLQTVDDVGPVVAGHIEKFFRQKHNVEVIEALLAQGVQWEEETAFDATNQPLAGEVWVLTGTLHSMTRDEGKVIYKHWAPR